MSKVSVTEELTIVNAHNCISPARYKHKKTGNIYIRLAVALDCTNERGGHEAGRLMVIYHPDDKENTIFVRDQEEFNQAFDLVES